MDPRLTAICVVQELKPKYWEEPFTTAIDKGSVAGRLRVGTLGLAGDVQCDSKHHGGRFAALYAYADEDAASWADELGYEIPPGRFGENLRTSGLDLTRAEIGERWQVGEPGTGVVVEVTAPRTPCRTFSQHMGEPRWVKRFTDRNAPGAYLRVREKGTIGAGDAITVTHRPGHGVTVGDCTALAEPGPMRTLVHAAGELDLELDPGLLRFAKKRSARA